MESSDYPKVSIIIPFYKNAGYLEESVRGCLNLDYPNFEILIVANSELGYKDSRIRVITTKKVSQSEKKDLGVRESMGEICAFIDDDAFPRADWLKNAVREFHDPGVGIVCGPGITPETDSFLQKAGGVVYSSPLGSGPYRFRYIPTKRMKIDEFAGYNFLMRRDFYLSIGGIGTVFRSGDDTILSQKTTQMGKLIIYNPDVVVYHHRRALFRGHLSQIKTYALHRGYFLKTKRKPSAGIFYLVPIISLFLLTVAAIVIASFPVLLSVLLAILAGYMLTCLISTITISKNLKMAIIATVGIFLTHIYYICFMTYGFMVRELNERPSY